MFRGILFRFYFREHTGNLFGFSFVCNISQEKSSQRAKCHIGKGHFWFSVFVRIVSFHSVSFRLFLVSFVHFLVNFYVICGILLRQSFVRFSLFCIFFSLFLVASLCPASCRHKFNSIYSGQSLFVGCSNTKQR